MELVDPLLYALFIGATALLVLTPGPIVSLTITETLSNGPKNGLAVTFGAAFISSIYLTLNYVGFTAIQSASAGLLDIIRYCGVAYLLYMAYSALKAPAENLEFKDKLPKTIWATFRGSLFIAASNPKAILFFAAFFPQFISRDLPIDQQLIVLSLSFIGVTILLDSLWVFAAAKARNVLAAGGNSHLIGRISGVVLGLAAVGLLFLNT